MTRTELEAFLEIVQAGSLSGAAKALYITQPALTRRIQALERELGYCLFRRGQGVRRLGLTEQGELFLPLATKWMGLWNEARGIPERLGRKSYTIVSNDSIAACLLPPALERLTRQNPEVDVKLMVLHSVETYRYMERGLADIALIADARFSGDLDTTPLSQERLVLLSDPAMGLARQVSPAELEGEREIYMDWTPGFERWHSYWFPQAHPHLQIDSTALLGYLLAQGGYWAVAPWSVGEMIGRQGRVACSELREPPPDRVCCCLRKGHFLDDSLLDCFRAAYGRGPGVQLLLGGW